MRIALIKSSSMGDVIHALPVVSDVMTAYPGTEIDWIVEEAFGDLVRLHPQVRQTVAVAIRRWRRTPFARPVWAQIGALRGHLREQRYDLALDLQGLIKSAWLSRLTGAPVTGFARGSARESLATLAYRQAFPVPANLHAIERLRALAGLALGYVPAGLPRFGLRVPPARLTWCSEGPYAVFLHATSRAEKQWPADHWRALAHELMARGLSIVLPWGSAAEYLQAQQIAVAVTQGMKAGTHRVAAPIVAPRLSLADCAVLLNGAAAVVGVDTGLTHLAAALSRPTVALFAATQSWRYGPYWSECATSLGASGVWPLPVDVLGCLTRLANRPDGWQVN